MTIIKPTVKTLYKAREELQKNCEHVIVSLGGTCIYGKRIAFLLSRKVDTKQDGSMNGLDVDAIGIFPISMNKILDYNIFCFTNFKTNQPIFLVLSKDDLIKKSKKYFNRNEILLRFWLTSRGASHKKQILETNGIGAEFEFMGLWLDENRDYTYFHNNWSIIGNSS